MDRVADQAVKERGILFRGEMVRAILDGRKTQTRRVISPQPLWYHYFQQMNSEVGPDYPDDEEDDRVCPYGKPGDRLWVRETWAPRDALTIEDRNRSEIFYRADDEACYPDDGPWHPAIHMFRWASRINLEIKGIRVERLQEISKADCIAEGMTGLEDVHAGWHQSYAALWDSMRAGTEFAWEKNPWIWVIEFRRIS